MKLLLTLLFFVGANFAKAQQLSAFYDAGNANRSEFSYNVTVKFQKNEGASSDAKRYTATLVQASPDSKGFYNANYDKKYYTTSQLGNIYNPNNIYLIGIKIIYECNGKQNVTSISFRNLNEQQYVPVVLGSGGKFCESIDFNDIEVKSAVLNPVVHGQIIDKINQTDSTTTNQDNKTNTEEVQDNATPNNTSTKPLDNYDPNTGLYSNPMTNSTYATSYNKDLQRAELVIDVANGILDLFATSPEEKARKEREAAETRARIQREESLRREAAAAAAAEIEIAKAKRLQMIASRKTLFKNYPDGKTPLSYQAKEATEVYFFTYSYQAATLEEDSPLIYISNVFSISKYGDGSWPFKSNLLANVAKTNKGLDLILSGYYESREKAEEEQQLLENTAKSYEFSVKSISYNGIKSEDKSNTSTDYWGNEMNKTNSKTISANKNNQASKTSANNQDFWGNPTIKDNKKALSSTPKKQVSNETKVETDYWGNTTKTTRVMVFGFVYFQKCNSEEVQQYRKLLVDEDSYDEELKIMEAKLNEDYPNAKRIMVGSSKFEYGSGVDHMCLIKWRAGSKACSYFVHSISFGKTQKEALNNALNKKNTYADKKAVYEIVEQKYW